MPVDEIRTRVKKSIAKISGLKFEQIGDHDSFELLELDSLSRIEVLVELEREFKLDIPEDEEDENLIREIQSIEQAVQLVQRNLASASAA
jgi:acyl carrier protein